MPLQHAPVGSKGFGENIAAEEKAGKPQKQAEAIAYKMSGEKNDGIDGEPANITNLSERCDAIADAMRECAGRMDAMVEATGKKLDGMIDMGRTGATRRAASIARYEALGDKDKPLGIVEASGSDEALKKARDKYGAVSRVRMK